MKCWHYIVLCALVGVIAGAVVGAWWAFDFDTDRLKQGAWRVVIGATVGGVLAFSLGSIFVRYIAGMMMMRWR